MGHKHSSLAFDDVLKEFESEYLNNHFEPELKVLVNVHYGKNPGMKMVSQSDIIQVSGNITVSF